MSYSVIIPARFASTRLPGKPLADIAGQTMLQRVWAQACKSSARQVIIATDDERIVEAARAFGAEVCLTRADHESGTDRLQEVAAQYGLGDDEIVVNVQGDEPLIPPAVIDQVAANLANSQRASIATLGEKITDPKHVFNPNIVKVVRDLTGHALYFSRAPMPWYRDGFETEQSELPDTANWMRHIGIYAYRVGLLNRFVGWQPGVLESCEKLEQLRAMENGESIHVELAIEEIPGGVDTPEDLERVRQWFIDNPEVTP